MDVGKADTLMKLKWLWGWDFFCSFFGGLGGERAMLGACEAFVYAMLSVQIANANFVGLGLLRMCMRVRRPKMVRHIVEV